MNTNSIKQKYLEKHHNNVALYAGHVARLICPEKANIVSDAAALHDVGKTVIDDKIIFKPGALDEADWEIMRRHPVVGVNLITKNNLGPLNSNRAEVALAVLHHHERFDGTGYPDGIGGEDIPIAARIIAVVDAFDAMTTNRPYQKARSKEEAIAELILGAGSQFDPIVVSAFTSMVFRV